MLKALGPGILMAGAAIGGSHIVASTQAGAFFGWQLLIVIILVNLFKYPFFLYGERYTAATGETILHGYHRLGRGYLYAFFALNLANAVLNCAGTAFLAASLALNLGLEGVLGEKPLAVIISCICASIIILGRYRLLDKTAKLVIFCLAVSTVTAVLAAALQGPAGDPNYESPSPWTLASIGFLIQFMGWMPAPIDVGAWPSLWMQSREKETGHRATMREAMIDFHLGYITTVVLAVVFLTLGVLVMHGTGADFGETGAQFAHTFISMYANTIGDWATPIVAIAAFTAMFSTALTCVDAWPRSLATCTALALGKEKLFTSLHIIWILLTVVTGIVIITWFTASMGQLLFIAMVVSFATSPVFAYINYRTIQAEWVPLQYRPGPLLRCLSWTGMAFLSISTVAFFYWLIAIR
ncbi:NRAMP family divalent metal transporter [Phycisphaerales bacterium AB-hyl4]|uniref:NRAMP family divalent metal transporter n=1 Tax=Natronomicrosphaera hydrolytica TaxID=3242702 RepID=A0ABV4U8G6_9BACT